MGQKSRIIRSQNPRKQHVISEMHLRKFEDNDGKLYVYEKGKEIRQSHAGREAVQRDYFECSVPGHETNYQFEKMLADLEAKASLAYSNLIEGNELPQDEMVAWALYVSSTFLRSRKVRQELAPDNYKRLCESSRDEASLREEQYKIAQKTGRIFPLEDIRASTEKALSLLSDPAYRQISSLKFSTPNLARALCNKRWQVVTPAAGLRFITSDAPAVSFGFKEDRSEVGLGWGREEVHIGMPLDPSHFFVASPLNVEWNPVLDVGNTWGFIGTMAQFSYQNVYGQIKDAAVQKLVDQHAGTLIFGKNAFTLTSA